MNVEVLQRIWDRLKYDYTLWKWCKFWWEGRIPEEVSEEVWQWIWDRLRWWEEQQWRGWVPGRSPIYSPGSSGTHTSSHLTHQSRIDIYSSVYTKQSKLYGPRGVVSAYSLKIVSPKICEFCI